MSAENKKMSAEMQNEIIDFVERNRNEKGILSNYQSRFGYFDWLNILRKLRGEQTIQEDADK